MEVLLWFFRRLCFRKDTFQGKQKMTGYTPVQKRPNHKDPCATSPAAILTLERHPANTEPVKRLERIHKDGVVVDKALNAPLGIEFKEFVEL